MVPLPVPGARLLSDGSCRFTVWAPTVERVDLEVSGRSIRMRRDEWGYHEAVIPGVRGGTEYRFLLNGRAARPDPASRFQPHGVHGPSAVVADDFPWTDVGWANHPLADYVIYELHVGTFSREGTFDGVVPHLRYLRDLGVTAIECMPIAQFPGGRNWGYDGVLPYAAQNSYGGPVGFRRLVDACHREGLAVVLDVVYNHLGPEGNHLGDFGPYFTDRYRTPWGQALNFDGAESDHVRNFFLQNALYWTRDCHVDALRLDAVHAILDHSAMPFIEELGVRVHEEAARLGRPIYLIAESSDNDARLITEREQGGLGMDAQWADEFHHAVHTLLTGERDGYYQDFGEMAHLEKALRDGFVYTGQYSAYRRRRHGTPSKALPGERFVICIQNHDQVGNRLLGERLSVLVPHEAQKLAAVCLLLAPYVPMLFMGEEYGETAPFQYFISHTDPDLVEAVRKGRAAEFADFGWTQEPPDPYSPATFEACKLDHGLRESGKHAELLTLYRKLLDLRRRTPALATPNKDGQTVWVQPETHVLVQHRRAESSQVLAMFNFSDSPADVDLTMPEGRWRRAVDSASPNASDDGDSMEVGPAGAPVSLAPYQALVFLKE